jgi:predicted DNA-binding protein (MmcQ/YjbR family)
VKPAFERPIFQRARRLCLELPETTERESWGHPNFRAGKKTFCTFEIVKGRPSMAFRLPPADIDRQLRRKGFFATPYGRGCWVSAWLDRGVAPDAIAALVERSYRCVAIKRMLDALNAQANTSNPSERKRS